MAVEAARVVQLESQPLVGPQPRPAVIAPVPAQLAVNALVVITRGARPPEIACQDVHGVPAGRRLAHRRLPDQLVPAEVMGWVHVPDREDPHRVMMLRAEAEGGGASYDSHWYVRRRRKCRSSR